METAVPREKLKQLMEKNGEGILQDRDRCEGLLKDYCGGHRREISAIVGALEERIPLELKSSWQTAMTPEAMRARLVQRLEDNRGLAPEIANYAVDTWSYAFGVGLGPSSDGCRMCLSPPERLCHTPIGCGKSGRGSPGGLLHPKRSGRDASGGQDGSWRAEQSKQSVSGGVGLLAAAAVAFALLHHPNQPLPRT